MNTTIFDELRKGHDYQRTLLKSLISTEGDSSERNRIFNDLKFELSTHAKYEERYFYVPIMTDNMTQKKSRHGIAEHQQIDKLVDILEETDMASPSWLVYAKQLKDKVEHHLAEEEKDIFQISGKVLSEKEKKSLAKDYRDAVDKQRENHTISA